MTDRQTDRQTDRLRQRQRLRDRDREIERQEEEEEAEEKGPNCVSAQAASLQMEPAKAPTGRPAEEQNSQVGLQPTAGLSGAQAKNQPNG